MEEKKFFFSIKAAIFHESKLLIIKRSTKGRENHHRWEIPGGRLEFSEKPSDALCREIQEETGLADVKILGPMKLWEFLRDSSTQVIGVTCLCKSSNDSITLSDEHLDYRWILKEEIPQYDFCPGVIDEINTWEWDRIYRDLGNV